MTGLVSCEKIEVVNASCTTILESARTVKAKVAVVGHVQHADHSKFCQLVRTS